MERDLARVRDRSNKRAAYWRQNLSGLQLAAREKWEQELTEAGDLIPPDLLFLPQRSKNLGFLVCLRDNEKAPLHLRLQAVSFMLEHDLGRPAQRIFAQSQEIKSIEIISNGSTRTVTLEGEHVRVSNDEEKGLG